MVCFPPRTARPGRARHSPASPALLCGAAKWRKTVEGRKAKTIPPILSPTPALLQEADAQEVAEQPRGPGWHRGYAGRSSPGTAQDAGRALPGVRVFGGGGEGLGVRVGSRGAPQGETPSRRRAALSGCDRRRSARGCGEAGARVLGCRVRLAQGRGPREVELLRLGRGLGRGTLWEGAGGVGERVMGQRKSRWESGGRLGGKGLGATMGRGSRGQGRFPVRCPGWAHGVRGAGRASPAAHQPSCLPRSAGAGGRAAPARAGGVRAAPAPRALALPLGADPQPRCREASGGRGTAAAAVPAAGQCGPGAGGSENPRAREPGAGGLEKGLTSHFQSPGTP